MASKDQYLISTETYDLLIMFAKLFDATDDNVRTRWSRNGQDKAGNYNTMQTKTSMQTHRLAGIVQEKIIIEPHTK